MQWHQCSSTAETTTTILQVQTGLHGLPTSRWETADWNLLISPPNTYPPPILILLKTTADWPAWPDTWRPVSFQQSEPLGSDGSPLEPATAGTGCHAAELWRCPSVCSTPGDTSCCYSAVPCSVSSLPSLFSVSKPQSLFS